MSDVSKTNAELIDEGREATTCRCVDAPEQECGTHGDATAKLVGALADALFDALATRVPVQGEPNNDREALALWRVVYTDDSRDCDGFYPLGPYYVLASHEDDAWNTADEIPKQDWPDTTGVYEARHATADEAAEWMASRAVVPDATPTLCAECNETEVLGKQEHRVVCMDCAYEMGRCATVPDAATELAAIKARAEEVGGDEGWHIGGAWGDYGEVVVPLRILSYVIDGQLDEKILSTDPGYAATYAEQVARADRAEAERDAALAAVERVRDEARSAALGENEPNNDWNMALDYLAKKVLAALDGAPEPELEYTDSEGDPGPHHLTRFSTDPGTLARRNENRQRMGHEALPIYRRRKAGPWERVEGSRP